MKRVSPKFRHYKPTKFSRFTKFEFGPKKLSGDFLGFAPPEAPPVRALSIADRSNGELAPLPADRVVVALFEVSKSKSSRSVFVELAGAHGSAAFDEAVVRAGG